MLISKMHAVHRALPGYPNLSAWAPSLKSLNLPDAHALVKAFMLLPSILLPHELLPLFLEAAAPRKRLWLCNAPSSHGRMFPWLWGDFLGLGGFLYTELCIPIFFQFPLTCHSPGFMSSASGAGVLSGRSRHVHIAKRKWISRGCSVIRILSPAGSQTLGREAVGRVQKGRETCLAP